MLSRILFFTALFIALEYIYISLAKRFRITDKPNLRSSHVRETIRGGGIIFPVAALIPAIMETYPGWITFSAVLFLLAAVSFADDIVSLSSQFRLGIQTLAIMTFIYFAEPPHGWLLLLCCFIIITGVINIYNFMDGINGITALYTIVSIGSLFWISQFLNFIITPVFFICILASLLAFSFFNLRKKAVCFAGDVGSVSVAFIICFLLLRLIISTGYIYWLLLLSVYGIDAIFTICCRIVRGEKIMEAHRSHFYQFLVNDKNIPHITVSMLYAVTQLLINITVIVSYQRSTPLIALISLSLFVMIYIIFRFQMEGKKRLFSTY